MEWIKSNAGLKLIALVLATVGWFFVKALISESRTVESIPLEIRLPPGFAVTRASAATVAVVLRGAHDDIRQVTREQLSAVLNLAGEKQAGEKTLSLGPTIIRHPPRVQVVQVVPSRLTVHVEELIERDAAVISLLTGELPAGYEVERTNVIPSKVRIKGPRSLLEPLTSIETLPIDLTGRRISFRERVDLAPPDPNIMLLNYSRVEADVRIRETPR